MTERVFRGGVVEGGAPFTKDAAYQRGYCRTFNFLRAALEQRDLDLVRAFLAGQDERRRRRAGARPHRRGARASGRSTCPSGSSTWTG